MKPLTFLFGKKKKINSFRIDQTSSKNTKRYSVKHLLIKYKLVFFDALHQCFASTLMQKDFFFVASWHMENVYTETEWATPHYLLKF